MNITEVLPALRQCHQKAKDRLNEVVLPTFVREMAIGLLCDGAAAVVRRVSPGAARQQASPTSPLPLMTEPISHQFRGEGRAILGAVLGGAAVARP